MADIEGESPSFDELKPLGEPLEETAPAESEQPAEELPSSIFEGVDSTFLADLSGVGEDSVVASPLESIGAAEDELIEAEKTEPAEMLAEAEEEELPKGPSNLASLLELGAPIGIPAILLTLAALQVLTFPTAIYVISVGFVAYGVWKGRKTNNVYTIILACSLVAILTAVYCLWMEFGRYHFDVKAREAKQRVSMSQPTEAGFLAHAGNSYSASNEPLAAS